MKKIITPNFVVPVCKSRSFVSLSNLKTKAESLMKIFLHTYLAWFTDISTQQHTTKKRSAQYFIYKLGGNFNFGNCYICVMLPYALSNLVATLKLEFLSFHSLAKNTMRKPFLFTSNFEKKG